MISPTYWEPVTERGDGPLSTKKQDVQVMKATHIPPVVRMEILTPVQEIVGQQELPWKC